MNTQPWIDHFKHTVGKSTPWSIKSKMVLLRRGGLRDKPVNTESLPLKVVSPTEQFAEMAKASIDKNTPKYVSPSVASHTSRGAGGSGSRRGKRRGSKKKKKNNKKDKSQGDGNNKASSSRRKRRRKTGASKPKGDIFS